MKFILLFIFICMPLAHAQKAQVLLIDEDIDQEELKENFHVHKGSTHINSLPDRHEREMLLTKVKATQQWDELKRDIFYMDLKSKSLSELKIKYPELKEKEIKLLKSKR